MIPRQIQTEFETQLNEYPIVTLVGPRQAGKTTLARSVLPDYTYVNLENPDTRQLATEDPRAFLKQYPARAIFDEIQRAPHLLSYLQGIVDENQSNGQFVLTGSHQLQLRESVSQSLAGRTGILHLLPLSIAELTNANIKLDDAGHYIFQGFLPRVYDQQQRPHTAYSIYFQSYIERDVRQLINLKDVVLFEKFMKLLAGRVGQIINYQSLANDTGVDGKTIKDWLSILEASYVIFRLPPYFENFGKRVIKTPKIYFTDTGLLCYLLGIERVEQVARDPLIGALFENLIILEALKTRYNAGLTPNLYFFRDNQGHEIDLLHKRGHELLGIEIKSASTWHASFKRALESFHQKVHPLSQRSVIYSGEAIEFSDSVTVKNYKEVASVFD
ncbi:MAG: ATP-binding protein [Burkholderiaceae bacterium]|nr:ATP-binding protein [Burkholderiaceae bacterium]